MEESKNSHASVDEWFTARRFVFLLAVLIVAAFPDVVFGFRTFFFRDFGFFGAPLAFYHRECFWRGELPLWNPLNDCGLPFLAQWNTMVLYPGSLIYLLFPLPWSLSFFCLVHQFLAGLGMYFLARRWTGTRAGASVAGVAFAFNGLTLNCLMWPNNIGALAWMPWLVLWVERGCNQGGRAFPIAAAIGALQVLTGAPEIIFFTWLIAFAAVIIAARRERREVKRIVSFVGLAVLVTGLASAQLLPFFDLLMHSQRSQNFADSAWSLPISGLANFFVPAFRYVQSRNGVLFQTGQYWTSSYYCGIGVLALALMAGVSSGAKSRERWLFLMTIASVLLALGDRGYVYAWIRKVAPLGFVRYPIKFIVPAVFCLPLLASFGYRTIVQNGNSLRTIPVRLATILGALLLAIAAVVAISFWFPVRFDHFSRTLLSGASRAALLIAFGVVLGWVYLRSPSRGAVVGLVSLAFLDALTHLPRQNPTLPSFVFGKLPRSGEMPRLGLSRAMISREADAELRLGSTSNATNDFVGYRLGLFSNCNLLEGIPKVNGFYSLYLREMNQVVARLYDTNQPIPAGLLDFLGVAKITSAGELTKWENRPSARPLVTMGAQPLFVPDEIALRKIFAPDFDPQMTVYLPIELSGKSIPTNAVSGQVAGSLGRESASVIVDASAPCWLVIAQAAHHSWKAFVDNRPQPIVRANYSLQAIAVPEGRHELRLVYRDRQFAVGSLITAGCFLLCVWLFWQRVWFRRQSVEVFAQ